MAVLLLHPMFEFPVLFGTGMELSVTEDYVYMYVWEKIPGSNEQKQFILSFTNDLFLGCDLAEQWDFLHPAHSTWCVWRGTSWFYLSGWLQVPENLFQHKQLIIHVPVTEWMKWRFRTSEGEARAGVEPSTLYLPVMQKI